MRAYDETCDDIAQNERLFECLGYDGEDSGGDEDDGQVLDQIEFF